jgi:hypothetical protein
MSRSRVKFDFGPHGKVIASVTDFEDARQVAATRLKIDSSAVRLYVKEGTDLWELDPSAFSDVVSEKGVINVQADATQATSPAFHPNTSLHPINGHRGTTEASTPSEARILRASSASGRFAALADDKPNDRSDSSLALDTDVGVTVPLHRRRGGSDPSDVSSSEASSSSSSGEYPSDLSGQVSSSGEEDTNRRSASVQDVTASVANIRAITGHNSQPISSNKRWDSETHRVS